MNYSHLLSRARMLEIKEIKPVESMNSYRMRSSSGFYDSREQMKDLNSQKGSPKTNRITKMNPFGAIIPR